MVLACARTHVTVADRRLIEELGRASIDWSGFRQIAADHAVTPLVWRTAAEVLKDRAPHAALNDLNEMKVSALRTSVANVLRTREMLRVLEALEAAGVPAVCFKGPLLAHVAYRDLDLREFSDVDLLVPKRQIFEAVQVMEEMGFARPEGPHTPRAWRKQLATEHHVKFHSEASGLLLEVHWAITPMAHPYPVSFETIEGDLQTESVEQKRVPSIGSMELLLILCIHGSKHQWRQLKWICDIAELVRAHPHLDLEAALTLAKQRGVKRMVLLGLGLANKLLGLALPDFILHSIEANKAVRFLIQDASSQLFETEADSRGTIYRWRFHIACRDHILDRLRYVFASVALYGDATSVTDRDLDFVRLPALFSPLYYFVRPVRVGSRFIGMLKDGLLECFRTSETGPG